MSRGNDSGEDGITNELDDVLPAGIDRRRFLQGAVGTMGAAMFAGCGGDGGGNGNGNGNGTPYSDMEAVFTTPWKKEPSWGHAHVAEGKGYWGDAGMPNIDGKAGNGSDTESANIGTGNKPMGIASLTTAISVFPGNEDRDQLDMSIVGLARGRPLLSLIWRKDMMEDRADVEGNTILAASGFAAATTPVYPALVGADLDNVTFENSGEESAAPKLANGDVAAVWGSIDLLPVYREEVDAEVAATPLTAFGGFPGFPIWVNNEWYEGLDNGPEVVSRVMTGYFKAVKWGLLNQSDYLDYLKNNVNENLQTWTEDELTGQHSVNAAQAVTLDMKEEGLGYFTEDGVQNALDAAGEALLDDPSTLPSASDMIINEPWENTERVTFTDNEWDQLADTAALPDVDIWTLFEDAESGN
jgi:ABC-type nitrate/sulfonate/bicarbonate transport system substrate-binding protein